MEIFLDSPHPGRLIADGVVEVMWIHHILDGVVEVMWVNHILVGVVEVMWVNHIRVAGLWPT